MRTPVTSFGRAVALAAGIGAAAAVPAGAQGPEHVLVVVNEASSDSIRVGEHYAKVRGIDQGQVFRVNVAVSDEISRLEYEVRIERPIATWLAANGAQDRILFIVLTKGLPLRVAGTAGRQGTTASIDSELALLYRKLSGQAVPVQGSIPNPYFLADRPPGEAGRFAHERHDIYLVTRLDGFTAEDAIALVDRAAQPAREGRIVLDLRAAWTDDAGNRWLRAAADRLTATGRADHVLLETTSQVVTDVDGVLGYYSWGSNDPAVKVRRFGLGFLPGAIGAMFVSSDGRTFREPPAEWAIGTWDNKAGYFAGSPQSLAGDLVREGITGIAGHVSEPFLDATIRPDVLFPAYLSGFTLAEAFYLAMPYLSWQTVVVGDPLCQVAARESLEPTVLNPPLDPETDLPAYHSGRRLSALFSQPSTRNIDRRALALLLKAETRLVKKDPDGAERALVEATEVAPNLEGGHLLLAARFSERGDHEAAAERYRLALQVNGTSVMALNNLAYEMAVHLDRPGDALPLAERAYALSPGNATVADTVAWVHHLMGNQKEAVRYAQEAVRGTVENPDIWLHVAVILAEVGQLDRAREAFERAVALRPSVRETAEGLRLVDQLENQPSR
jgi:uncharacterized protein (TIGR03790 family)